MLVSRIDIILKYGIVLLYVLAGLSSYICKRPVQGHISTLLAVVNYFIFFGSK